MLRLQYGSDRLVKGYEYKKGITPEEIKAVTPPAGKIMDGHKPYALFLEALRQSEYGAVAKLTMHEDCKTILAEKGPGLVDVAPRLCV